MSSDSISVPDAVELAELNARFEEASPEQILGWATATYPTDIILTCSFQHEGVVLAHMLRTIQPDLPVVFINTRFHFKETLEYRDAIVKLLGLNLKEIGPRMTFEEFTSRYGQDLYNRDPDLCCKINKVDPLLKALEGVRAWLNGRRRDQSVTRTSISHVEVQGRIVKINPLARWTSKDTYRYLHAHNIPLNPLFERGYTSVGCEPCTSLPLSEDDERSGRWASSGKRECGIHTVLNAGSEDGSKTD
jgi:phosphoadenosine phosphosulfate reductase